MRSDDQLTYEERKRRLFAEVDAWVRDEPPPRPIAVLTIPVNGKIADAVKINPGSVRISARGADGIAVIAGPERNHEGITLKVHYADRNGIVR
jgi:hypothetical protein